MTFPTFDMDTESPGIIEALNQQDRKDLENSLLEDSMRIFHKNIAALQMETAYEILRIEKIDCIRTRKQQTASLKTVEGIAMAHEEIVKEHRDNAIRFFTLHYPIPSPDE